RQAGVQLSAGMEALILRAMSKDPALRPQNAAQFREELLSLIEPRPISHPELPRTPTAETVQVPTTRLPTGEHEHQTPVRPRPSSPRRAFWLGALVLAATGALAFFWG